MRRAITEFYLPYGCKKLWIIDSSRSPVRSQHRLSGKARITPVVIFARCLKSPPHPSPLLRISGDWAGT
jgi:hypothetical protein